MYLNIWSHQQFQKTSSRVFQCLGYPVTLVSWHRVIMCLLKSGFQGMYIFSQKQSKLSTFDHSIEYTILLASCWSSCTTFAMGFSWSLVLLPCHILENRSFLSPLSFTSSKAQIARSSGQRMTMFSLSEDLSSQSEHLNKVFSLPIEHPG